MPARGGAPPTSPAGRRCHCTATWAGGGRPCCTTRSRTGCSERSPPTSTTAGPAAPSRRPRCRWREAGRKVAVTVAQRLRIVVIGLPELGHLLEVAEPHGVDVVTIPLGSHVGAVLADKARGATRATLLFVVADCSDPAVNALPDTLARAGFRGVVLAGLPGASGTFGSHDNLHVLPAPFSANDVLASLSGLPDVPFFLPVAGGDHTFGELAPEVDPRPAAAPVPVPAATAPNGRRERNGILFPRREHPDEDPLGPPVRVLPLDPLPAPPPPP